MSGARAVRAFAELAEGLQRFLLGHTNQILVIDCARGERKHRIAEEYLAAHTVGAGVFLILVARGGVGLGGQALRQRGDRQPREEDRLCHHYSFHIMDSGWGHLTVKMSGTPPGCRPG